MKLEEGKYYKTRDGHKVGPIHHISDGVFGFEELDWYENGKRSLVRAYPTDIIAEWQDGPIREVTKKELVPGFYGRCKIIELFNPQKIGVRFITEDKKFTEATTVLDATELREAAALFNELADYLDSK